jgi:hypothetical protein
MKPGGALRALGFLAMLTSAPVLGQPAVPSQNGGKEKPPKLTASAIQIEPIEAGDINIPAEFRFAIYERLVQRIRNDGTFQKVFRGGDLEAANVPGLVTFADEGWKVQGRESTAAGVDHRERGHDGGCDHHRGNSRRSCAFGVGSVRQGAVFRRKSGRDQRFGQTDCQATAGKILVPQILHRSRARSRDSYLPAPEVRAHRISGAHRGEHY